MKQFVYPYIMYKDTRKAVEYYNTTFGGDVKYTMLGKDTPNCPEDQLDRIMHLEYEIQGNIFYLADDPLEDHGRIHLHLDFQDRKEMEAIFNKFKKESKVIQELGETFWGAIFGTIIDPFGVHWQFHYSLRNEE